MKTKLLMLLLATGMGIASCSSSRETTGSSDSTMIDGTGTETMGTGDTTSTGTIDTSGTGTGGGTGDTTGTGGGTTTMPPSP